MTSSRDKGISSPAKLSRTAMLLGAALMLSYLESLIPLPLPIPGFKLGLANIALIICFEQISPLSALFLQILRISISALLFGSPTSLWFSLAGGAASYIVVALFYAFLRKYVSELGISIASAAMHNMGQLAAAAIIFSSAAVFNYLPWLLFASIIFGSITGIICRLVNKAVYEAENRRKTVIEKI